MSKRIIKLYLSDIIESIGRIEKYVGNLSFGKFIKDTKTIDATVRNLIVIGEAINNVPKEVKSKHPEIPWAEIIGMRNKIIHEYFGVDEKILWQTIQENLPSFKKQIRRLLKVL